MNCGERTATDVTYDWSFEPSNPSNTLQSSDLASYSSVADNDAVLVIDLQMFASANVDDHYDFTVTGSICSSHTSVFNASHECKCVGSMKRFVVDHKFSSYLIADALNLQQRARMVRPGPHTHCASLSMDHLRAPVR